MHEQNFERQVRQTLDELSLVPSPPVWEGVEAQIRRRKERWKALFWMLPLILVALLATWFLLSKPNTTASTKQQQNAKPGHAAPANGDGNIGIVPVQKEELKKLEDQLEDPKGNKMQDEKRFPDLPIAAERPAVTSTHGRDAKLEAKPSRPKRQPSLNGISKPASTVVKGVLTLREDAGADVRPPEPTASLNPIADTIATVEKGPAVDTLSAASDSVIQVPKPKKEKKKTFEVGLVIAFGSSGVTTSMLDGFGAQPMSDFYSGPLQNSSGGISPAPPSRIRRGPFYAAGVTTKYLISSRASFSAGLQYQQMNTRINVGARGDSSLTGLGTTYFDNRINSPRREYTNAFHFLSLPVSYQYQLHKRLPLYLSAGATFSRLLSTNALHYSANNNVYYRDSSAMKKNAAGLFTSLTYGLRFKKGFRIEVGPQFQYHLTSTSRAAGTKPQHLYTLGLKSTFKIR